MKKVCYKDAVEWLALKDKISEEDRLDLDAVASQETSRIIADLFEVKMVRVGNDVIECRRLNDRMRVKQIVGSKTKDVELF